jgi:hypothetical protein
MRVILFVLASCLLCLGLPDIAQASWYTLAPATMRSGAGTGAFVRRLAANETLSYLTDAGKYARVATLSGTKGFVPKKLLSKRWVRVFKVERRLELPVASRCAARRSAKAVACNDLELLARPNAVRLQTIDATDANRRGAVLAGDRAQRLPRNDAMEVAVGGRGTRDG